MVVVCGGCLFVKWWFDGLTMDGFKIKSPCMRCRLQGPQSVNFMVGHLVSAGRCGGKVPVAWGGEEGYGGY